MKIPFRRTSFFASFWLITSLLAGAGCQRHVAAAAADCLDPNPPRGMCPMVYEPVCGCDGKTYANACVASQAGVRSSQPGPCALKAP